MKTRAISWLHDILGEVEQTARLHREITLSKGEIWRVNEEHRGVLVECRKGCVWVTQKGDPRDIILERGDYERTSGRGLALIESIEPAVVRIS